MGIQKPPYMGKRGTIEHPAWYAGQKGWGNRSTPDVYVIDVNPQYPVGTKFTDSDRVYFYGYCTTVEGNARAGQGMLNIGEAESVTTHATEQAIGDTVITIADTTPTAVLNRWAGGYFCPMSAPYGITYRVISNTITDGTNFTITLERGLAVAVGASTGDCRLNQQPYIDLCSSVASGRGSCSNMGIAVVEPTASRYIWIQTWGPANIMGGDERLGSATNVRAAMFNVDGTLVSEEYSTTHQPQMCGYAINDSTDGASGYTATWFVYLQLAR